MYFYRIECSKFRNLSVDNRSHWCQSELFSLLPVTLLMSQQSIAHVHGIWSKTKYNKGFLDTRRHRRRPAKRKLYKYERQEKKFAMFFVLSAITKNGRVWSEREKKNRLLTRLNFFIICILLNMLAFFPISFHCLPPFNFFVFFYHQRQLTVISVLKAALWFSMLPTVERTHGLA